jgi:hypothetical protein
MKKFLFSALAITLLFSACKKEDKEEKAVTPTKENLSGIYKITKIMGKQGSAAEQDVTGDWLDECERDDLYKLNTDYSYEWIDAGTKCFPAGGYTDSWNLLNSLTVVIDGDTYNIKSFDGKTLVLDYAWSSTVTLTATYVKQ